MVASTSAGSGWGGFSCARTAASGATSATAASAAASAEARPAALRFTPESRIAASRPSSCERRAMATAAQASAGAACTAARHLAADGRRNRRRARRRRAPGRRWRVRAPSGTRATPSRPADSTSAASAPGARAAAWPRRRGARAPVRAAARRGAARRSTSGVVRAARRPGRRMPNVIGMLPAGFPAPPPGARSRARRQFRCEIPVRRWRRRAAHAPHRGAGDQHLREQCDGTRHPQQHQPERPIRTPRRGPSLAPACRLPWSPRAAAVSPACRGRGLKYHAGAAAAPRSAARTGRPGSETERNGSASTAAAAAVQTRCRAAAERPRSKNCHQPCRAQHQGALERHACQDCEPVILFALLLGFLDHFRHAVQFLARQRGSKRRPAAPPQSVPATR